MSMWFCFLTSLLLTTFVSFLTPIIISTLLLTILGLAAHVPVIETFAVQFYQQIWQLLITFGDGSGISGILTISLVCAVAGFLFESLNFYRYQILVDQPHSTWLNSSKSSGLLPKSQTFKG